MDGFLPESERASERRVKRSRMNGWMGRGRLGLWLSIQVVLSRDVVDTS